MKCLRSNFIIFALSIYGASQLCGTSSINERSKFNHLLLKAVQQTLRFFKMPNVYIFNYDSEGSPNTMIRMFHENLIPTSIGSEVTSDFQVRQGPKILMLTVKNCADIVSPILSLDSKLEISRNSPDFRRTFQPQKVCADSHEKNRVGETNTSKTCNLPWNIGEAVLREGSRLPKRLKELRQRLMLHPVWNAANYLIFAVRINDVTQCDLPLVFKLIWRLFRGHKAVICLDERCLNYDPFNDVIHSYTIESEVYFDFSISNLRGKRITALLYFGDNFFDLKFWSEMMDFLVRTFRDHVGGSQVGTTRTAHFQGGSLDRADFTKAIEDDADVVILEDDLRNLDFRHLEVLSVLDSGQICFIVPERGPMPSYLTPVKCFTGAVWRFIFGTIVLFVIVHEIYRRFCIRVENSQAAENVSTVFAVYSYVLCVGQSRLLVDFSTGKILFGIFSFSFLILSSVFLSLMVDNLSKRLRYAPLNTVEEVRDSELLLQSVNRSLDNYLFSDEPRYEWIKERFINSWEDIWVKLGEAMAFASYNENQTDVRMFSWIGANISEVASRSLINATSAILRNDAFIVFVPHLLKNRELMSVEDIGSPGGKVDLHIVDECIMSYPYDMRLLANSVYGSEIKKIVGRLREAGISAREFERIHTLDWFDRFRQYEDEYENVPLRAFSMMDLRIAFLALIVGLVASSFAFVAELLTEFPVGQRYFQNMFSILQKLRKIF